LVAISTLIYSTIFGLKVHYLFILHQVLLGATLIQIRLLYLGLKGCLIVSISLVMDGLPLREHMLVVRTVVGPETSLE